MRGRVVSPFTLSDAGAAVQDQTNVHVVTDRKKIKSMVTLRNHGKGRSNYN